MCFKLTIYYCSLFVYLIYPFRNFLHFFSVILDRSQGILFELTLSIQRGEGKVLKIGIVIPDVTRIV